MKYICIVLLLSGICFAQFDPNCKEYEVTFKLCDQSQYDPIIPDSMYFAEGDTLKVFFGFESGGGAKNWKPALNTVNIKFDNTPNLWTGNIAETQVQSVDLYSGKWQIRIRAHGFNGEVTDYSERVDIGIRGFPRALKRIIIR